MQDQNKKCFTTHQQGKTKNEQKHKTDNKKNLNKCERLKINVRRSIEKQNKPSVVTVMNKNQENGSYL